MGVKKDSNNLISWLLKYRPNDDPPWADLNWQKCLHLIEQQIQCLREIRLSEWICHLRPAHLYYESPVAISFTNTVKNKFRRETPASQMSSVITLLWSRKDLILRAVVTDMGKQNALGVIGLQGSRNHVVAFSCQRQGGCGYCNGE